MKSVQDVPHDFHAALDHAIRILAWQENLPSDEMPPRWMWNLDWELEDHFLKVDAERRKKYGGDDQSISDDGSEPIWDENVYAARFKE